MLNESEGVLGWNIFSGEVNLPKEKNRNIPGSNIIDVIRHALDPGRIEPTGYAQIFPYLPRGSTPPEDDGTTEDEEEETDTTATTDDETTTATESADDEDDNKSPESSEWEDIEEGKKK